MGAHRSKKVKDFLESEHVPVKFLPADIPNLNPIEHIWSVSKEKVKKFKPINRETLLTAISQ